MTKQEQALRLERAYALGASRPILHSHKIASANKRAFLESLLRVATKNYGHKAQKRAYLQSVYNRTVSAVKKARLGQ